MFLVVSIGLTAFLAAANPSIRLVLLPVLAVAFAKAFADRPRQSLAMLLILTSLPIYIQFGGHDAMVLSTALIAVAYTVAATRRMLRRVPRIAWPVSILVVLYVMGTAGVAGTPLWGSSIRMLFGVVSALMLGHIVYSLVTDQAALETLLRALAAMLIVQAGIAVLQVAYPAFSPAILTAFVSRTGDTGGVLAGGINRAVGTVGDYELLSEWFAGALPVFLCLVVFMSKNRWLWAVALFSCAVGMLVTVSRGGIVAAALGVAAFVSLLVVKRAALGARALAIGMPAIATAVLALALLLPNTVNAMLVRLGFATSTYQTTGSIALSLNRTIWAGLPQEATHPTAFGHGIYRLGVVGPGWWGSPHSLPLALWYQVGVVGCMAALWILCAYALAFGSAMRWRSPSPLLLALSCALCAGFVATMASELIVEMVRYAHTTQYFAAFMVLGLTVFALCRQTQASN